MDHWRDRAPFIGANSRVNRPQRLYATHRETPENTPVRIKLQPDRTGLQKYRLGRYLGPENVFRRRLAKTLFSSIILFMIKVMIVLMIGVTAVFGIVIVMTHRGGMWPVMTSASSRTVRNNENEISLRMRKRPSDGPSEADEPALKPRGQHCLRNHLRSLHLHRNRHPPAPRFIPPPTHHPRPHANSPPNGDSF